jgi:hypothetical protein
MSAVSWIAVGTFGLVWLWGWGDLRARASTVNLFAVGAFVAIVMCGCGPVLPCDPGGSPFACQKCIEENCQHPPTRGPPDAGAANLICTEQIQVIDACGGGQ